MKYGFTSFLQRSRDKGAVLFISYEEVITLTEEYFADFPVLFFGWLFEIGKSSDKCTLPKEGYVEKNKPQKSVLYSF